MATRQEARVLSIGLALFVSLTTFAAHAARNEKLKNHLGAAQDLPRKSFKVCGKLLHLEVADEPQERATGLMHRQGVPAGTGMLFSFARPQVLDFWMKNVPFDIDIAYFDADGRLLRVHTMKATSPLMREAALPMYSSDTPALFAVEATAGLFGHLLPGCKLAPLPAAAGR